MDEPPHESDADERPSLSDDGLLDRSALERLHTLDELGAVHPGLAGIEVDWREVGGVRARVLRAAGRGTGPTTVLVHGLGGSAMNWLSVMHGLADRGDVVAVDLPGFGESEPVDAADARPRANARWLAALLRTLDDRPVTLVGNSMGGLVSTLLAGTHPHRVGALVLLCPALPAHLPSARLSRVQLSAFGPMLVPVLGRRYLRRRIQRMSYEERYDQLLREATALPDELPATLRAVGIATLARERDLRWRGRAFREAASGTMGIQIGSTRTAVDAAIRAVTAPTLYVRGRLDQLVLASTTAHVRRIRPDWRIVEPAHVAHVPMFEDPAWTTRTIHEFVADVTVGST